MLDHPLTAQTPEEVYDASTLICDGRVKKKGDGRTTSTITLSRDEKTRTSDLHVPNVARYQLCYIPRETTAP